jgi:hypothetical protein
VQFSTCQAAGRGVAWKVFTPPERHDERLARLVAAVEETRTLIERHAAIMASSRALLAEAGAALDRSRRLRERLEGAAHRARRNLTRGERRAPHG